MFFLSWKSINSKIYWSLHRFIQVKLISSSSKISIHPIFQITRRWYWAVSCLNLMSRACLAWAREPIRWSSHLASIKCTGCQRRSRSSPLLLTVTSCHIKIGGEVSAWTNATVPTNIFAAKVKLRIYSFNNTRFQRTNCCLHNNLFVLQRKIIVRKGSN